MTQDSLSLWPKLQDWFSENNLTPHQFSEVKDLIEPHILRSGDKRMPKHLDLQFARNYLEAQGMDPDKPARDVLDSVIVASLPLSYENFWKALP